MVVVVGATAVVVVVVADAPDVVLGEAETREVVGDAVDPCVPG